jgi:GTPase SAR1 family protein
MSSDEIELSIGDLVTVSQTFEGSFLFHLLKDGWCMAINISKANAEGLLPLNFLVPYFEPKLAPRRMSVNPAGGLRSVKGFQKPSAADLAAINDKIQLIEANSRERFPDGENMPDLKIMVCGDSGIGKSELVNTFASQMFIQQHGDPVQSDAEGIIIAHPFSTRRNIPSHIKSEASADFNLRIFDTIGYGAYVNSGRTINPINNFLEDQFNKTRKFLRPGFGDSNTLVNMMSASGAHTHVDVVLFGIFHRMKPLDVEWLKKLSPLVPIVPILMKSDTLSAAQLFKLKETFLREIMENDISVFTFGLTLDECLSMAQMEIEGGIPFAISNVETDDGREMYNKVNEMELLKEKVLFTFGEEIRRQCSSKFITWRESKPAPAAFKAPKNANPTTVVITDKSVLSPSQTQAKVTPIQSSQSSSDVMSAARKNAWDGPEMDRSDSRDSENNSTKSGTRPSNGATGTPFGKFKLLAKSSLRPK